jgi:GNAT superfamily N-acetyltransferase
MKTPIDSLRPSISVRPAKELDIDVILQFIRELAEYERLSHEVVVNEQLLQQFLFGERPAAEAIIAEYETAPAGFALFFQTFSTFVGRPGLYLEDLYVNPSMRDKGIGKALLRYIARLAVERGLGRLEWSVLDWNESAVRFYERLGADAMDDWIVYRLTDDALAALSQ